MAKTILIVEDDRELCEELAIALTDEGYDVTSRCDGVEGNMEIFSARYDFVLLDLRLPGLSGIEILRGIRSFGKEVKIIVMTANTALVEKFRAGQCGDDEQCKTLKSADAVMAKPLNISQLVETLREVGQDAPST